MSTVSPDARGAAPSTNANETADYTGIDVGAIAIARSIGRIDGAFSPQERIEPGADSSPDARHEKEERMAAIANEQIERISPPDREGEKYRRTADVTA